MLASIFDFFTGMLLTYPEDGEKEKEFLAKRDRENFLRLKIFCFPLLIIAALILVDDFKREASFFFKLQTGLIMAGSLLLIYLLISSRMPRIVRHRGGAILPVITAFILLWITLRSGLVPENEFYLMTHVLLLLILASFFYFSWPFFLLLHIADFGLFLVLSLVVRGYMPADLSGQIIFLLMGFTGAWFIARIFYFRRLKNYLAAVELEEEIHWQEKRREHLKELLQEKEEENIELRKKIETLKERKDFLLARTKAGFFTWEIPAGTVNYDHNWAGLLDYHVDKLRGRLETWLELIHPGDRKKVKHYLEQCLQGELAEFSVVQRLRTYSGAWKWIKTWVQVVEKDEEGCPLKVIGINRDISVLKRLERERKQGFKNIVDNLALAVMIYRDREWIYINRAAEALTGCEREKIKTMKFSEFVHPDYREVLTDRSELNLSDTYTLKIISRSGEEKWIDFAAGKIEFKGERAIMITAFDITGHKSQ